MSAFDTLEQQLRDSARRRGRAKRRGRRAAARWVPLVMVAAVAAFLVVRSPAPPDEREAAVPTPAPTWTPVLGDDDRGHPSISRSPVPAAQAAAYTVLRRPQSAADRSPAVRTLLTRLSPSSLRGLRVDAIRRLDEHAGRTVVLLSAEVLRGNPSEPGDDIRDGFCLLTGFEGGSAGMSCGSFHDALVGRVGTTLPPRGLAPDGAARVTVRVRGGRTISITPRNNYFDASWAGEGGAAGIARPRFYDADGGTVDLG